MMTVAGTASALASSKLWEWWQGGSCCWRWHCVSASGAAGDGSLEGGALWSPSAWPIGTICPAAPAQRQGLRRTLTITKTRSSQGSRSRGRMHHHQHRGSHLWSQTQRRQSRWDRAQHQRHPFHTQHRQHPCHTRHPQHQGYTRHRQHRCHTQNHLWKPVCQQHQAPATTCIALNNACTLPMAAHLSSAPRAFVSKVRLQGWALCQELLADCQAIICSESSVVACTVPSSNAHKQPTRVVSVADEHRDVQSHRSLGNLGSL
mmetsp:Transcript_91182/g.152725  ORF Transcript_91182/g.152725 Transcript_91182/m.152725 type:complete len:261 (-) Transcript_91182:1118-1900(-)